MRRFGRRSRVSRYATPGPTDALLERVACRLRACGADAAGVRASVEVEESNHGVVCNGECIRYPTKI
jgi:hypothetical protein